jgi:hypothetical protein
MTEPNSPFGTKRTSRAGLAMSVDGGRPEVAPVASSAPAGLHRTNFLHAFCCDKRQATAGNPAATDRNSLRACRSGLRAPAVATRRDCVAQY